MKKKLMKLLGVLLIWQSLGWLFLPYFMSVIAEYLQKEEIHYSPLPYTFAGICFIIGLFFCLYPWKKKEYEYKKILLCPNCKKELFQNTRYCPYCGNKISLSA